MPDQTANGELQSGLQPPLGRRVLSHEILDARKASSPADVRLESNISAHLDVLGTVLDDLESDHQALADRTDFELNGDTRYAATWQLSGRCIGLGRAVVTLLREGFCAETIALARTLHECTRLLDAVADHQDGEAGNALVERWLADRNSDYVRPREARAAEKRSEERHRQEMGIELTADDKESAELSRILYDHLSWFGHNRRKSVADFVDLDRHTMIRGQHPDREVVARYVSWGGQVIEETVLSVGGAFARFSGTSYLRQRALPIKAAIQAVRNAAPLPDFGG